MGVIDAEFAQQRERFVRRTDVGIAVRFEDLDEIDRSRLAAVVAGTICRSPTSR